MGLEAGSHSIQSKRKINMESEGKGEKEFYARADRFEHVIYEPGNDNSERKKDTPQIIEEINEYLKKDTIEDMENFTVEAIAAKTGISKNILYEWVGTASHSYLPSVSF